MKKSETIYIAGHNGLVGSAITNRLFRMGYNKLITVNHKDLDLTRQEDVEAFFKCKKPDNVILAAAKVGGIMENSRYPADFIHSNLTIQSNIIHSSYTNNVKKLLFLGSSCIYPKLCPQPMKEEYLLSGKLEPTNDAYALSKIAGIKMCQSYNRQHGTNYISVMPTNLYGPNDNFDLESSHALPAMMRKIHEAKVKGENTVKIWGTGNPKREFLYIEDLADACIFLMENYNDSEIINIGTGKDLTIQELAELIAEVVGYTGNFAFDITKPDGTPVKRLDVSKLNNLGWKAQTSLRDGLEKTYLWFLNDFKNEKQSL